MHKAKTGRYIVLVLYMAGMAGKGVAASSAVSPVKEVTQAAPSREGRSFMAQLSFRAIWNAAFVL